MRKTKPNPVKLADAPITWRTDDLSIGRVERILGADHVARFFAMPRERAIATVVSRAHGAWQANEREYYAAYRSLARLLGRKYEERDPGRKRKAVSHGLGDYDREYEWTKTRLGDLRHAQARALQSLRELRRAVRSGSTGQSFKAKQAAQEALSNLARTYDSAHVTLGASVPKLERLPSHAPFTKAHVLARQYRRELEKARVTKQKLTRVAFGSLEDMRSRLGETKLSRDGRRSRRGVYRIWVTRNGKEIPFETLYGDTLANAKKRASWLRNHFNGYYGRVRVESVKEEL